MRLEAVGSRANIVRNHMFTVFVKCTMSSVSLCDSGAKVLSVQTQTLTRISHSAIGLATPNTKLSKRWLRSGSWRGCSQPSDVVNA